MSEGFRCSRCGELHPELPFAYGADYPDVYYELPEAERERRCEYAPELCMIDQEHFFLRARIVIPVVDADRPFVWGVWVSQSQENFVRAVENWETPGREQAEPTFGWLCTRLPLYPDTLHLKTEVQMRPVGERPVVVLEPTDHPLAVEQREGITRARVREIAEALLHEEHEERKP